MDNLFIEALSKGALKKQFTASRQEDKRLSQAELGRKDRENIQLVHHHHIESL